MSHHVIDVSDRRLKLLGRAGKHELPIPNHHQLERALQTDATLDHPDQFASLHVEERTRMRQRVTPERSIQHRVGHAANTGTDQAFRPFAMRRARWPQQVRDLITC
ncbi:MAG TPA: hypothetical protein PLK19_03745 [Mycobacterium sp.]|jgi:hypothetical protein|nr:hypothetical protein [Mycobacterium sp.]